MAEANHSSPAEQAVQELAERLLSVRFPDIPDQETKLLVGVLPTNLPVALPLPHGARIVGTLLQGELSAQIVLDVSQSQTEILAFYRREMEKMGWQELSWPEHGGFTLLPSHVTFCQGRRGAALQVSAYEQEGKPTDLRLHVYSDARHSPCGGAHHFIGSMPTSLIPRLRPPAGVITHPQGGGGSSNYWYSALILESDLPVTTVARHFREQLEATDWALQEEEEASSIVRSTWRFVDKGGDAWLGMMLVARVGGQPQQQLAYIHAQWDE